MRGWRKCQIIQSHFNLFSLSRKSFRSLSITKQFFFLFRDFLNFSPNIEQYPTSSCRRILPKHNHFRKLFCFRWDYNRKEPDFFFHFKVGSWLRRQTINFLKFLFYCFKVINYLQWGKVWIYFYFWNSIFLVS